MMNANRYDMFRRQYAAGLKGLETMLAKATKTGRKVGGYTADQLAVIVSDYRRLSTLNDADMRAHLCAFAERAANRVS